MKELDLWQGTEKDTKVKFPISYLSNRCESMSIVDFKQNK